MLEIKYIVWVGGVADYEGDNLREAKAILKEWAEQGYDDAVIETIGD
jgi:hypothetical protein